MWPLLALVFFPALGAEQPPPVEAPGSFTPPQVILESQRRPLYPPAALAANYTGTVVIDVTILEDGAVTRPRVVSCTRPNVGFEAAALAAVKQWRFVPATEHGVPVEADSRIHLNFTRTGAGEARFVVAGAVNSPGLEGGRDRHPARGGLPPPPPPPTGGPK